MSGIDLSDYIPVSERITKFKEEYPDGRLTSEVVQTGHPDYVAVKAYVYLTPDDSAPATGLAWERVPGPTPFTKDSELQNAETAAWGRALIAALVADASRGIASRDEVARGSAAPSAPDDVAWRWLWAESKIFKAWSDSDRLERVETALTMLAIPKVTTMEDAKRVFDHLAGAYAERPVEQTELLESGSTK